MSGNRKRVFGYRLLVTNSTSLFGYLLQIVLQFAQILLQILTATHIEEPLLVTG